MAAFAARPSLISSTAGHGHTFPSSSLKPPRAPKRSRDDSSDLDIASSQSKRSRVTFDSDIEYVSPDDEDEVDPQLVREQVRRAIQRHIAGGDEEAYENLKQFFLTDPNKVNAPSPKAVYVHLQAVLAHVSSLDKSCNGLVNAVLHCEWAGRSEDFVKLYGKVVANLAAAQSGYLGRIMHTLVELLGRQRTRRLSGYRIVRQSRVHSRARHAIVDLLNLVPAASGVFIQVVQRKLTMDYQKPRERLIYIKNFLSLLQNFQALKGAVLGIIMSELIKLDVSVQVDMEDYADELGEELVQEVSSSHLLKESASRPPLGGASDVEEIGENDGSSTTTDESEDEEDDLDPAELQRRRILDHLGTVDAVMDLLFEYYHPLILSSTLEASDDAMNLLITQFSNLILPTYRSRHAQFLIFHFSQTSPVFVAKFATTCMSILLENKQPPVLRQAAGSYLAGFVGRGARVPLPLIRDSFQQLCNGLETLRQKLEPSCKGPDLRRYTSFYSLMQAIMYIFCFRWRDLALADDDSDDEQQVEQYHFPYAVKHRLNAAMDSPLNPLRICTPDIVNQFAEICRRLDFLYLYSKIESNKHVRLGNSRRHPGDFAMGQIERDLGWVGETGMLEGYFPFDPYRLPRSGRWLSGDYLEWKGLPGDEDHDEQDDEESTEGELMDNGSTTNDEEETATEEDA